MTELDTMVAEELDRLVPEPRAGGADWQDVLRRAGTTAHTRRLALIAALAAVALLAPLIAFATGNGWWFQRQTLPLEPKPVKGVPAIVAHGRWRGGRWTVVAYISNRPGFGRVGGRLRRLRGDMTCVSLILGALDSRPRGTVCSRLYGMKGYPPGSRGAGWVTFMQGSATPVVIGAVARGVAHLRMTGVPGGPVEVPLERVKGFADGIRFFAVRFPRAGYDSFVALDAGGKVLKRVRG
jgi:hypothetical protein